MTHPTSNNTLIDGAVAATALTLPWWAELLGAWAAFFVTIATLVLVLFRLILAYRELKKG